MSDVIKFFPSMVRYGLPSPVACWGMSLGIPIRRVAIEIAQAFLDEAGLPRYEEFLRWLNNISPERLHYEFGLISPILEDVSRAIFQSSVNPLLKDYTGIAKFLPKIVEVKGIVYEDRRVVALTAQKDDAASLIRDYDNLVDRNAIAVHLFERKMGYVPRDVAQVLATEMDTGVHLTAQIVDVKKRNNISRVFIRITEA